MAGNEQKTCPPWVDEFVEAVGVGIDTGQVPAHYTIWGPDSWNGNEDDDGDEDLSDPWVVHFYPSLGQVKGGANDGAVVYPGVTVDLLTVQEAFEDVEDLRMSCGNSIGVLTNKDAFRGTVLEVEGWYDGHPVSLKVFDKPPGDAAVESYIDPKFVHVVNPKDYGR
jgi:hypothetical protein